MTGFAPPFFVTEMQDKKELRKYFSAVRRAAKSIENDTLISARLLSCEQIIKADIILMYASFGTEPDTWNTAEKLICKNKILAFPKCKQGGIMSFHVVDSISELKDSDHGMYDICEPSSSLPEPDLTDNTVCIVPGLAFTQNGGRLGYGGGYYDRFLSANPNIYTIALAYEAVITDRLPVAKHDISINSIVTEERMVLCNAG